MTERIYAYPSIYNLGHKAIVDIFDDIVLIEEKIDGSLLSMMVDENGELHCRSKRQQLIIDAPEEMFVRAVDAIKNNIARLMCPGMIYRCEYLPKPKHNTLAYDRVPVNYLICFDVCPGLEEYLPYDAKVEECKRIGIECVPRLFEGKVDSLEMFKGLLETVSVLGGTKIEGVVVKNYSRFTQEKKVMMGKFVSEQFKEVHRVEWCKNNPTGRDITAQIIAAYRTSPRWQKAIQHLKERGVLEQSPRDIGNLIKEVQQDTKKECEGEIKQILFDHFWKQINRGIVAGLPEWYKEELLKLSLT